MGVRRLDGRLCVQAFTKVGLGFLLVAALLFVPAGTLAYAKGWLLIGILFVPMLIAGTAMLFRCPALLKKRLNAKEREMQQRRVVALSAAMFAAAFVLSGFNYRFKWLTMPDWTAAVAVLIFLLGYLMYAEVIRENAFLSRTIEIQDGQRVVDTGLYGVVRHPMYAATLVMFLSMPLVLGSPVSFAVMLIYIPIIVARIRNEEKVLENGLPGYTAYKARVKYRIIPRVW